MKYSPVCKLLVITLVVIFMVVPAIASTGSDAGIPALVSGYQSTSSTYSNFFSGFDGFLRPAYSGLAKPAYSATILKPELGVYKSITIAWDPVFIENSKQNAAISGDLSGYTASLSDTGSSDVFALICCSLFSDDSDDGGSDSNSDECNCPTMCPFT